MIAYYTIFIIFIIAIGVTTYTCLMNCITTHMQELVNKTARGRDFSVNMDNKVINNSSKAILYWDTFHGDTTMGLGLGHKIFKNCPVSNCFTTNDRQLMPVEGYDAILFHGARYHPSKHGQPSARSTHQKYIFYSWESAFNAELDLQASRHFYNWTMTFKKNADIYYPYSIVKKGITNYELPKYNFLTFKRKKIAWLASNCYTKGGHRRKHFVNRLQQHIPVDIYGDCGNLQCPRSNNCYKMIEKYYKFYLSFENSFCPDYVTEKLFNVLQYNIVPIVWGGANYTEDIAPPGSIINAREFSSTKKLADFLYQIDSNETMYLEYFKWKKNYTVQHSKELALCQLCDKLNQPLKYSSYENVNSWFYENCTTNMD